jgi:hypothetical protein
VRGEWVQSGRDETSRHHRRYLTHHVRSAWTCRARAQIKSFSPRAKHGVDVNEVIITVDRRGQLGPTSRFRLGNYFGSTTRDDVVLKKILLHNTNIWR